MNEFTVSIKISPRRRDEIQMILVPGPAGKPMIIESIYDIAYTKFEGHVQNVLRQLVDQTVSQIKRSRA